MFTRDEMLSRLTSIENGEDPLAVVVSILAERFSCRAFQPKTVPRETLDTIFSAAQLTGSWCNAQPWQVVVTSGDGTDNFRRALFEHATDGRWSTQSDFSFPRDYKGVYGNRRRDAGVALYRSLGITREDIDGANRQMLENYRLFGAPHVLILTSEEDLGVYGAIDCGIYLGNLMLLMQSRGIDSIAQGALARFSPFVREYFGIPANRRVVCGLSFGYGDREHPANGFRTSRAEPTSAVQWVEK